MTHRDVLRLAHPAAAVSAGNPTLRVSPEQARLFEWIVRGTMAEDLPRIVEGFVRAQRAGSPAESAALVRRVPAAARGAPAGAPHGPVGVGGPARGHADDGHGAEPRDDDPGRPARAGFRRGPHGAGASWRSATGSGGPGCTRSPCSWPSARTRPAVVSAASTRGCRWRGSSTPSTAPSTWRSRTSRRPAARLLLALDVSGSMEMGMVAACSGPDAAGGVGRDGARHAGVRPGRRGGGLPRRPGRLAGGLGPRAAGARRV